MTDIREAAASIYATLVALEAVIDATPDNAALKDAVGEHHVALNNLRMLLGLTWPEFLAYIGAEPGVMAKSGGTNKDEPPAPGGGK